MNVKEEIEKVLRDALETTGVQLEMDARELALYVTEQAERLALIAHEPGFDRAVQAAEHNIALRSGLALSNAQELGRARVTGTIVGVLRLVAVMLAT